jgi:pimeloyl-ACP methyl ester carboxylesterase
MIDELAAAYHPIVGAEAAATHARWLARRPGDNQPLMLERQRRVVSLPAAHYVAASAGAAAGGGAGRALAARADLWHTSVPLRSTSGRVAFGRSRATRDSGPVSDAEEARHPDSPLYETVTDRSCDSSRRLTPVGGGHPGTRTTMTSQLFWDRAGTGDPLLLLHGIGSTHDDFVALRPRLDARYRVLAPDLPGHGRSPALPGRPTIDAITDAITADLDELGVGRVHVLGNSIGARVAIELAARRRARSVVAISPSGLNTPAERLYQAALMGGNRLALRCLRPLIPAAARTTLGRSALLAGLRSTPWRSSETEARALRDGFADADAFWQMLWWGILADLPTGLDRIDCPVVLAQGTADLIALGQTPRYLTTVPGARFVRLLGAGHAPQSDTPEAILQLVDETTAAATAERPAARTVLRPAA